MTGMQDSILRTGDIINEEERRWSRLLTLVLEKLKWNMRMIRQRMRCSAAKFFIADISFDTLSKTEKL